MNNEDRNYCFHKDVNAFIHCVRGLGVDVDIMEKRST